MCGYSPRMRLDLTVNILTNHAVNKGVITVFGGAQKRPNIHIDDITDLYVELIEMPAAKIAGETFNAGYENFTVSELADIAKENRRTRNARERARIRIEDDAERRPTVLPRVVAQDCGEARLETEALHRGRCA